MKILDLDFLIMWLISSGPMSFLIIYVFITKDELFYNVIIIAIIIILLFGCQVLSKRITILEEKIKKIGGENDEK